MLFLNRVANKFVVLVSGKLALAALGVGGVTKASRPEYFVRWLFRLTYIMFM